METNRRLFVAAGVLVVAVAACGLAGVAAAGHGSPANFTVYPQDNEDRSTSATESTYVMSSAGADAFESDGLEIVDYYWIQGDQASFADCNPDDAAVVGIDRGNNNTGTQTDVDLLKHMKSNRIGDNRITLELFDEGDFAGDTINLNPPDATIAVLADCIKNTGPPGWYQFTGFVNGTTYSGDYEEIYLESHYFWVGDFESEEQAREELGPPPSERNGETPTPESADDTPTPTPTPEPDGDTPTPTPEPVDDTPTPTPTPEPDDSGGGSDDSGGGDADADGGGNNGDGGSDTGNSDDAAAVTPTPGSGPGFGPLVALVGLLSAGAVLLRRA